VNYEVPPSVDAYVHRVGRTGRAEAAGTAVTLVAPEELPALRVLEKFLNVAFAVESGPPASRRPSGIAAVSARSHGVA
jgi:superfamily II DNA/RNA helicase